MPADPAPPRTTHLIPARALGDGVLALVLAANLRRAGRQAIVYHDHLPELQAWVPDTTLRPLGDGAVWEGVRTGSDDVFLGDPSLPGTPELPRTGLYVFRKRDWDRRRHVLRTLETGARRHFGLTQWSDESPLRLPPGQAREREPARICLHPTSARAHKNWPPERFLALADRLRAAGHEPAFLLAAHEAPAWEALLDNRHPLLVPGTLDAVAATLQASGGAIVTDSGIGHLAAAVGTPTLSLFRKRSAARFWRPAGAHVRVVTAPLRLPGKSGHRNWSRLLSPARVHRAYEALRAETV